MVAVGFCSYWGLAVAAAAGSTAAAVAVSGYFYTTLGLSSLHCHGGVLGFCKLSLFRYQWSKEGQVCGLRAKVHVCRCGAFSVPRFDLVLDLVFFLYQNPSCSIQTRKRACFAFLFVGVNSAHEKRPVGNRRSDGIRSKTNRTMIVWSRLVKASVSNGERGFARSVPGQGSWRAFWLGIAVKRKHCKDFGVWVYQYPSINDTQNRVSMIPQTEYQWYPDTSIQVSMIPRTEYQWYPEPSINDTPNRVSMIPRYQYPSINDTQNQVSMIPWYQYPSINDTQNRVSMIPWYQYPSINDIQNRVSIIHRTSNNRQIVSPWTFLAKPSNTDKSFHPQLLTKAWNTDKSFHPQLL